MRRGGDVRVRVIRNKRVVVVREQKSGERSGWWLCEQE